MIQESSLSYVKNLLKNREPKDDYKTDVEIVNIMDKIRMEEEVVNDEQFTIDDFNNLLKKLRRIINEIQINSQEWSILSKVSWYEKLKVPIIVQLYDISKFFDRENLKDGLNALYNCGISGKFYRLLYELNRSTQLTLNTGVGMSTPTEQYRWSPHQHGQP